MKISCQNCSSKYTVSDEKVQGKTVKLKCKKCGATILVNAGGATTVASGAPIADHPSSPAEAASMEGTSYLVNVAEGDQRTMTIAELVAAYQSQIVTADTYVWADGMGDWQPLGQVEPIVSALSAGPSAAPQVAAAPAPYAAPAPVAAASSAETAASAASLAASARPAARREPGKRADVFGNEKSDDVATSAPLFSASAKAAASNAAAAAKSGAGREENSVLFSLSALTSKPGAPAPAPAPSRKDSREDSGLIDLKALAAAAAPSPSASSSASIMGHDDAGLFPLGVPAANQPAAPPVAANVSIPPPASKAPMFIGIGALVAALAIVGVFFAMRGGDEKPVADTMQPSATTPAAQPTPTQTATPTPTTEATAAASASATASASSAVASAPKGGTSKGGTSKGGTTTGGASKGGTSGGSAPASTPAKPAKGNCGCAAGDLMCAMKCSAK